MRIAIISDIHANLEAFQAVIADIDKKKPDKVICLGDLIGYGPNPDEVVGLAQQKGYVSVIGNHEAALKEKKMRDWLNFQAKENSIETEKLLSQESVDFCSSLPKNLTYNEALFVHGFPPDSILGYATMKSEKQLQSFFKSAGLNLHFVGHTHNLLTISWDGSRIVRQPLIDNMCTLRSDCRYIINAGSVGQPRDGDNKAKYILWDTTLQTIKAVHIAYDFATTSQKIRDRGFPEAYAFRLR